jgi:hypothetical protein
MQKDIQDFDLPVLWSETRGVPPYYADFRTEKKFGKKFISGPFYNSCTWEFEMRNPKSNIENQNGKVNENMNVDDWGRLHDEESKIVYPYKRIAKFVNWFDKEYGDYAQKQGWFIVTSDTEVPKIRYKPEDGNKFNLFFQVQRIDDPMEGEALFGKLKNDHEADELAKKLGLVLDEHGVVIGWDNEIFI